ncbi:MAG TPA: GNAT family N-acetyltransferase [Actinomycetes bacterium]|nr:GNAT family N-acetyltransferase [Actinomycetes bacterium]
MEVRLLASDELSDALRNRLRALLFDSFPDDFTEDDWTHGIGGTHIVAFEGQDAVGHASVISRRIYVADAAIDGAYVEAVAVDPVHRGRGVGRALVAAVNDVVGSRYPFAALSTSKHPLYEGAGWERWLGPTFVVAGNRWTRTEDEDAGIMVFRPPGSPVDDLTARIAVDERSGDDW